MGAAAGAPTHGTSEAPTSRPHQTEQKARTRSRTTPASVAGGGQENEDAPEQEDSASTQPDEVPGPIIHGTAPAASLSTPPRSTSRNRPNRPQRTTMASGFQSPYHRHRVTNDPQTSQTTSVRRRYFPNLGWTTGIVCLLTMSSMPAIPHADRWRALLAEHRVLQDEFSLATISKPPSRLQVAQLAASADRLEKLSQQVRELVDEWAATHA